MLIEQALYTLPEIMALRVSSRFYESSVSSAFAMSVSMLLASRGIENPHLKIQQEAIYGRAEALGRNLRADMLVKLPKIGKNTVAEHAFGFRRWNYIEAKFFRSPGRSNSAPTTENAGALVAELLRLMTLPVELQSTHRDVGRYLLHVYQGKPADFLAFKRQDRTPREWVQALLQAGPAKVSVELPREPGTLVGAVGNGLRDLCLNLDVTNTVIRPMHAALADQDFRFCLSRIDRGVVRLDGHVCEIPVQGSMGAQDIAALDQMREMVVRSLRVSKKALE